MQGRLKFQERTSKKQRKCIAPRPLYIRKNATWYTYGHDLTKNVTEFYKVDGTIATAYDYTPYGAVTAAGIDQPFQWSSEVYDAELGMVYYNYRHYNPMDGRWNGRDPIAEAGGWGLYLYNRNNSFIWYDFLGLESKNPKPDTPPIGTPRSNSENSRENCMGHALCSSGQWEQGDARSKNNPWPEETYLKNKGCREIKCEDSCNEEKKEQFLKLYEWIDEDQFHIVRKNGPGSWSGKCGQGSIYDFSDPDAHTCAAYNVKLKTLKSSCWCCPCKKGK